MIIIAIDAGSTTGYAIGKFNSEDPRASPLLDCGVVDLRPQSATFPGERYVRLAEHIDRWERRFRGPLFLVYERPRPVSSLQSLYAYGYAAFIQAAAYRHRSAFRAIEPAALKKFATGDRRATKESMIEAACIAWGRSGVATDHEADALLLLLLACDQMRGWIEEELSADLGVE